VAKLYRPLSRQMFARKQKRQRNRPNNPTSRVIQIKIVGCRDGGGMYDDKRGGEAGMYGSLD